MASIASDDYHSSTTTSDDHDTSFAEDLEPVGGTTANERRSSIPVVIDADAAGEANGGEYGLQDKDSYMIPNDFDVVTVHGLHGDREKTWQARDKSKRETVQGLADFKNDQCFRLMNYGYDTRKGLSKEGIAEEASKLLREIAAARELRDKDFFRAIVFVCHDIGGAIVKRALCQSITDPQYADIADSTKWIVFNPPAQTPFVYDMEEKIARLVFSGPKAPQSNVLLHAKNLARAVIECNEAFVESKIPLSTEILSVKSSLTDLNECIFNEFESTLRTGFTFSSKSSQPHAFLPCAEEMSELRSIFVDFKDRLRLSDGVVERAEESSYLDALVSQASPVRSIPLHWYQSHPLTSSKQYTNWLQNTRSDVLVVHRQKPMQRVSGFAFEEIVLKSSLDDISTYFSFDQNDDRYNNTRVFLATTAAQWVTKEQVAKAKFDFRNEMSRFHSQRALTDDDLLILLARVRSTYTDGETVFVLDNLDECADKLSSFWPLVAEVFESLEKPWKFLIFTKSADSLDGWLRGWPSIALEDGFSPDDTDPCVRDEIDCTLHQFDTNYAVGPGRLLSRCIHPSRTTPRSTSIESP